MRIIAFFMLVLAVQMQAIAFAARPSASGIAKPKAMLWQLIAPDGSEHLLLGTAHRLGLHLEQLPEVVGAIRQSNVLIGELSLLWGQKRHLTAGSQAMLNEVEGALSAAIDQLDKGDNDQEEGIALLQKKLRNISNIMHKTKELQHDPSQWHALQRQLQTVGHMFLPSENTQVVADGETRVAIGDTEVYFNPDKHLEFMVVQLLATALPELTTVYLTKQDAGETVIFHDPEASTANSMSLVSDLEEEYQQKLRKMLQRYGNSNPFANLLSLTLKHHKLETIQSALTSIALREVTKDYGDLFKPNAGISLDLQIRTALGKSKHVALEEPEELQQALNDYQQAASEHLQALDDFVGNTTRLKRVIDSGSLDVGIDRFKQYYDAYLKGDIIEVSMIRPESAFNPYFEDTLIDARNINWMRKGGIQAHCKDGNQCLVYAGFSHFLQGKNPLFKLLQQEGFAIKELTAAQRDELIATSSDAIYEYEEALDGEQDSEQRLLELVQQGAELSQRQRNEALLEAIRQENVAALELLIASLATDDVDRYVSKAANIAALLGKQQTLKLFVSKGASDFNSYLTSAAYGGNLAAVKYLINQGADNIDGALTNAMIRGHKRLVKLFISELAQQNHPRVLRRTLNNLLPFYADGRDMETLKFIVAAGADDFNNLLVQAASVGNAKVITLAIKHGADNLAEAFLQAVYGDHSNTAKYLFDLLQQNSSEANDVYSQAFSYAVSKENIELAKFMINGNAISLDTATVLATSSEYEELVEFLVQKGIDAPSWSTSAWALEHAATNGWTEIAKTILSAMQHNPREALLLGASHDNEEIVEFILQIGVDAESIRTARELALVYGNDSIQQLLDAKLEAGG